MAPTASLADEFRRRSLHHLRGEYLPRIERACAVLGPADLWWRPHAGATSVANLLLHLEGNVRQWILVGLGGREDRRERAAEFSAREGAPAGELLTALRGTVEEACTVIGALPDSELLRVRRVQVFEGVTGMAAILHVVEHFSWHTGQIAWIAKLRSRRNLGYYDDDTLGRTNR